MQEFKGTPGPWHVSNENALRIRDDQSFVTVATAGYVTNEEELATAYLIAAAPELLEALQLMLDSQVLPVWHQSIARAAINKALGK
ncbi:TPA: hypothetical protein OT945_003632 [Klebsiella pneumoniae]|uniref:hypothetical protein n=1 Tax=Klebsiella pneumoniae TaxID=573 RepID=UPI00123BDA25|nr:hypothetical protein [Klebsiella pneumoniae]QET15100.1 hypothetical protein FOB39_16235 [Klebsiella pneumoniae]HCB1287093.1 hypothetical protein [Klebsiella pneumoniae]HCC2947458.1 hypothetical protein [Klebsiella pneumoniae]HCT8210348.1 hypothetical protein [Klebsiella pneumoniae]HCT8224471.1 hypothetical protein [Klebsiella pneumoniae]